MSGSDNKEQYRRFMEEVVNQKNLAAFDGYMSDDFVEHEDLSPFPSTPDGVRQFFAALFEGLPDLTVTIDDITAEGDKVWARSTWNGTHRGELLGIPATNKEVSFGGIDIIGYAEGKAAEHWGVTDTFSLMTQLGVISPPG